MYTYMYIYGSSLIRFLEPDSAASSVAILVQVSAIGESVALLPRLAMGRARRPAASAACTAGSSSSGPPADVGGGAAVGYNKGIENLDLNYMQKMKSLMDEGSDAEMLELIEANPLWKRRAQGLNPELVGYLRSLFRCWREVDRAQLLLLQYLGVFPLADGSSGTWQPGVLARYHIARRVRAATEQEESDPPKAQTQAQQQEMTTHYEKQGKLLSWSADRFSELGMNQAPEARKKALQVSKQVKCLYAQSEECVATPESDAVVAVLENVYMRSASVPAEKAHSAQANNDEVAASPTMETEFFSIADVDDELASV